MNIYENVLAEYCKRPTREIAQTWKLMGHLANGESIFYSEKDGFAVEKEHDCLVEPNKKELEEIFLMQARVYKRDK